MAELTEKELFERVPVPRAVARPISTAAEVLSPMTKRSWAGCSGIDADAEKKEVQHG